MGLAISLEVFSIDVCCMSKTHAQNSSDILRIRFRSVDSKVVFYVPLSKYHVASAFGLTDVSVPLSTLVDIALIDCIPINSHSCAVRLGFISVRRDWRLKRYLFVIFVYTPIDCNPNAISNEFYHQFVGGLSNARLINNVILSEDLNALVGYLGTKESRLVHTR